jgi:hypothetical protein
MGQLGCSYATKERYSLGRRGIIISLPMSNDTYESQHNKTRADLLSAPIGEANLDHVPKVP